MIDLHKFYMNMALKNAIQGAKNGEVPTGCVIIDNSINPENNAPIVIGSAFNQTEKLKDPTAHAEILAITQASSARNDWRLNNTTIYITKEPCAMCAGAIILARITTVVFGVSDAKRGGHTVFNIFNTPTLNHKCNVISGVMEKECLTILQDFFKSKR